MRGISVFNKTFEHNDTHCRLIKTYNVYRFDLWQMKF